MKIAPLLLLLSLVAGSTADAQPFGSLSGAVVDPLGAVLPGVRVALVQPERQARYEIRTDPAGRFEFQGLLQGDYQLEADCPGFQTYHETVTIAGQSIQRPIALNIGRLQETIRVTESNSRPASPVSASAPYTEPPCPTPSPTAVGGNLRAPRKLRDVKPEYPAAFRGSGRDVTIVVDAVVGLDGLLKDFQPRGAVDPSAYDALLLAVREWRFSSTLLNCVPQEVPMTITAAFVHQ